MGKTGSLEQCASSESSMHDESYGNQGHVMNAPLYISSQEISPNASQGEITQPVFPYPYPDPFYGGLYTIYGPHNMIQPPLMTAVAPGRVPLPVDIPEDGPIYVNAKQYHGILRRRQTRAKLEAQHKLVKTRKPYLHESRHQHALNRVRGSGGRFLSTKKTQQQQADSGPPSSSCRTTLETFHFNEKLNSINSNENELEANNFMASSMNQGIPVSNASDGRFSTIPPHVAVPMQGSGGGLAYNGSRCYASIVR